MIPLKMDRKLLARMTLAGQFRRIHLKTVFTYHLGAMPWSLAGAFEFIQKTKKSQLAQLLQKNMPISYGGRKSVLDSLPIATGQMSCLIFIMIYLAVRSKRSSRQEGVRYKNILRSFQVKSWSKFLSASLNKTKVVKFIVSEWKKPEFTSKLESKLLFVTLGEECWKLGSTGIEAVPELQRSHEEADDPSRG